MVDPSAFEVGRNIAVTPGAVVLRTEVLELIQYRPQTEQVREVPLLIVPPTINKYYALDLAPGPQPGRVPRPRAASRCSSSPGATPTPGTPTWGLDTYVRRVLDALDAVERVSGTDRTALIGVCSGGIIASITAAYLAGTGAAGPAGRVRPAGDRARQRPAPAPLGALADRRLAAAAKAMSRRRGYLDGRALAEVFAWLRPGDLVWNYWVNNYLLGKKPPGVRHPVLERRHHPDARRAARRLRRPGAWTTSSSRPGALTVLGIPVDLSRVDVDAYVVAGIADHITPWQNCYRTTQLLGGDSRFVLSTSGHIAALVNPPGNPKASYQVNKDQPGRSRGVAARAAETQPGSWWPDFAAWLGRALRRATSRPRNSSAAAGCGRSSRPPAPTSSTAEESERCTRASADRWAPTTSTSPTS